MTVRWTGLTAVVLLALVGAGACGGRQAGPPAQPAASQPPPAAVGEEGREVEVTMHEFGFRLSSAEVPAGRVTFEVRNEGTIEHNFIVAELGQGTSPIPPGGKAELTVDLQPGTYTVVCDIPGHKEAGMSLTVTVR